MIDLLEARAASRPGQSLYTFLEDAGGGDATLTYGELHRRARQIGAALQAVAARGERAVLLYPPGLEYIAGFFGCLFSGLIAVPAYPPDPARLDRTLPRLRAIIEDARATAVLTTSFILSMGEFLFEQAPDLKALRWIATDALAPDTGETWQRPEVEAGTLAFLQYTSGSTGTPKGVMLTHGNLLHNLGLITHAFQAHAGSRGVIWLPPYHDMGLIGGILQPLYTGFPVTLLSPLTFLKQPLRWLQTVSHEGATISGGPNFAFELCVRKIPPGERQDLDLSRWEVAFCGAEPIRPETLDRFTEAFGPCGFRREAFYPCYGLAEGTLIVSGGSKDAPPLLQAVDAAALERNQAVAAAGGEPGARTLVGCGHALPEQRIRIVHPESLSPCPPGTVGEIWVSGPSVARGYWQRPEETARAFQARIEGSAEGPFLRTGDLGFLQAGELFVTGRHKDLIILRGRNHYPQDLELTVERSHPALRPGCGAAFPVEGDGEERLVVVQEVDPRRMPEDPGALTAAVRQRLAEEHEVALHALVLIEPGSIPKTSSGKVQRRACRAGFLDGELRPVLSWRDPGSEADPRPDRPPPPASLPESAALGDIESWLSERLSARLRISLGELAPERPVTQYGLDSLAAVELAHEIEQGLGVALPMEALLKGASLSELSQQLFARRSAGSAERPAPIPRLAHREELPLSPAQQRLWFLDQLEPQSCLYNLPGVVRLEGDLDVAALERALGEIVRRHEALRTSFRSGAGEPVQVVSPLPALELDRVELRELPGAEREPEALRRVGAEARRPFDLTRGPLLRAVLLRLDEREHVLALTVHHLVSDGASMAVLIREVAALYGAFSAGRPSPLPELPLQYGDFALWQRERLRGALLEGQLAWWRRQLAGAPRTLELPTDRPRPARPSSRGASHPVALPRELWTALGALGHREGATPFMVLLAAFQVLLHRYAGQDDLCVGAPIAGRDRPELKGLIGFFVNTLVLRGYLSGNPTFRELLGRTREVALGAYAHQDLPFERLVEALQPERRLGQTPLFQVMLALQEPLGDALALPGLALRTLDVHTGTSAFDLTLSLREDARGLAGAFEYRTDLFDPATVARMAEHLSTLLEGIAEDPEQRLAALPLMREGERRRLLQEWSGSRAPFPEDACIHGLFEAVAARTPDAIALAGPGAELTYRELDRRANQLAHHLRKLGVGPEARVGLCVEHSPELVVGMLGILKAGGAWVPLDPGLPLERLAFMLEDCGARVLLSQRLLLEQLPADRPRTVCLDADWEELSREPEGPGVGGASADNLAYVIYTSGTTGRPKGTLLHHRGLCNTALAAVEAHGLRPASRVLQFASIGFDASIIEIFGSLLAGARLCQAPKDELFPGPPLRAVLEAHGVTVVTLTPSALAQLDPDGLPALETVLSAGEACPPALARRWKRGRRFINAYGPTEVTICATLDREVDPERPAIGRPLPNVRVYVLDGGLSPVPVGIPGELYVGGIGLARGYLGRADLTAERFLPDPFGTAPGERLYRTGDRVRFLPDGRLEFLGRVDRQVKVRGQRVEPGEVEAVLAGHPAVCEAAVVARQDASGDARLVAYTVARPGHAPVAAELRGFLQEKLPPYMVPAVFMPLDALPLTPNGKVDRKALPAPDGLRPEQEQAFVTPRNELEQRLATYWAGVLGLDRVGIHDDFFALGGHSLLATRLVSQVREAFGVELPVRAVFEAPTVAGLAERLAEAAQAGSGPSVPPPLPVSREGPLPLSFAQQRLFFLDQLEPGSPLYNMAGALRLEGRLDADALERSLGEVVRRHEALRTTFRMEEGGPVQLVSAAAALTLTGLDFRVLPVEAREAEVARRAGEEARRPFDLARGPLFRATLLRLDEREHVLLVTMHHIVSDGWSIGVLVRELAALYEAFSAGRPSPLPELPLQFADYAHWQREWLRGATLDAQLDYWRRQLTGAPQVLELPTDRPRPAVQSVRGASLPVRLPAELAEALGALAREEGATPFMTLLAAFQVLLSRYSGQDDVCVGSPIAGRGRAELEGLIGFFVNTLVLRARLLPDLSFRALLAQVKETTLGAYAHQDVPFEKLVDALQPARTLSHSPLFQVMFALQNAPLPELRLPGLALRPLDVDTGTSRFDLTLSLSDASRELAGTLEYNTDLFDRATAERLVGHLRTLLEGIVAAPDARLAALPLLTRSERRQLLVDWNAASAPFPEDACVHALFEAQVERSPGAVAVFFENQRLTYRELDERANRLAHFLRERGVGPEVRVGLCVERSLERVVGILGVLKAGGAWVPLDPSYPRERLALMLEDAGPKVLLTQERLRADLPPCAAEVVCLDSGWEEVARRNSGRPVSGATADNLAYVIYTSGSTGRPKGTLLAHRGLCSNALVSIGTHGLGPRSRVLQFASFSFDSSVLDTFTALLAGARLCLAPKEALLPGEPLRALLQAQGITKVTLVPSVLARLEPEGLPALETVVSAGEACTPELARRWRPGRRFLNEYGPTEATVCATVDTDVDPDRPGIGRPLPNVQVYVLDARLAPVPVGVPGELFIGGVGLARGYLHRPELTAERFLPDSFGAAPGARLYRTGDRVRHLPDGKLEYLGRFDQQVKVRGFRIELGEIEAALARHPAVREAVVAAREDAPGQRRLVAYVVPGPERALELAELRAFLVKTLPEHLVPSAFVRLEALPLTPNGKVDRKALPAPDGARLERERAYVAPRTPVEEELAAIWAAVLGVDRVGVHDNFFALGGDSILSLQILARANRAGLGLTAKQLFQHQTVAELAPEVKAARPPVGEQGPVTGPVPLTPIQRQFFGWELPDAHHFNQAVLLETREPVNGSLLERALQQLVEHHDALRLRFARVDGQWTQHNAGLEQAAVTVRHVDLSEAFGPERSQALAAVAAELQGSLDLTAGPLLRAALFDLGRESTGRLLLVIHHLAVDGVSWRTLLEDLGTACAQLRGGGPVALPPKTTSFKAWAERLEAYARWAPLDQELPFWRAQSAELPPLPVDAKGANTWASVREHTVALDAGETRLLLQEVPAAWRARIDDVLLAALARAFARWTGQPRLRVDLEKHGREALFEDVDLSRTVGWFTAVHPVLLEVPEGAGPGAGLRAVRDALRNVPGGGLGYGLLRYLRPGEVGGELGAPPPAEVGFNYLGQFDATAAGSTLFAVAPESAGPTQGGRGLRPHLLDVGGRVLGGRLELVWAWSENLHRRETVEALARDYLEALRIFIAERKSPDARRFTPADFPLASLDAAALDRIVSTTPEVEDLYPLSPMQQGLLFHALLSPGQGEYLEQSHWRFRDGLDVPVFRQAWQALLDRHPMLRTRFAWEDLAEPVQLVHSGVALPWAELDLRGLSAAVQRARLDAFLEKDRARGFDLARAPLFRLTLVHLGDREARFVWSFHHVLLDGWSVGLLLEEVFASYEALRRGGLPRRERSVAFREYIAWLKARDARGDEAYWRQALAGVVAPTPLPAGEPSGDGGQVERNLVLPESTTAALQAFARGRQLTLNTLVQAAWAILLGRHAGEQDVVFGSAVAGRPPELSGAEAMVGLLINSLPARVRLPPDRRLVPWLQELQSRQVELRQHEQSPLVQIQGWSEVPRGRPLFDTLLAFENYPVSASLQARLATLGVDDYQVAGGWTNYALVATAGVFRQQLILKLVYAARRFDPGTAGRLLEQWQTALEELVARPEQRLSELSLLTGAQRHQLLVEWNRTEAEYPRESSVHALFEAQAARTPEAVAVEYEGRRLTYGELDHRANQLAHHLRALGVEAGDIVGLSLERSLELVVGILGVLKAGAAYLPLDTSYPRERLAYMRRQARARVLVTQASLVEALPFEDGQLVPLDSGWERISLQPGTSPGVAVSAEALAYVMFTSGSTGQPKGVGVPHRAVVRLVRGTAFARLDERQVFLQLAPISFDASTFELWGALLHGAKLVVFPAHNPSLEELGEALGRHGVTTLWLTAALFDALAASQPEALGRVPQLLAGGDVLPVARVKQHLSHGNVLINGYGPTEGTTFTCCHVLRSPEQVGASVSIGRPIANTRVYLLDASLSPVPVGVPGELYVGGDGLAWGYLHRPELTAERFIPDPFGARPGERLYRTGDLARWLPDGNLEFRGRCDAQVKLRGFRIEPGEIEAALAAHPAVREAVVGVREDVPGDKRLVAYAVARPEMRLEAAALRQHLARTLPDYMVPSAFVVLEALPLTPNGKVDRKALPAPEGGRQGEETFVAPRNEVETLVADLWAQVLRVDRVGAHDDFFALGGHSLLATQLVSRIRTTFQVELPLRTVFEAPTLEALAGRLDALAPAHSAGRPGLPGLLPGTREEAPLSFAQQRLWFLDQLQPGSALYNIPTALRLEGDLDIAALERSFGEILRRHQALRTAFQSREGQPIQVILPPPDFRAGVVELQGLPAGEREAEVLRRAVEEARRPFELSRGPLLRAALLRLGAREHVLLVTMHHIASDGWSIGILVRELAVLYEAFSAGQPSPLPELPIQYADHAAWQREWLRGEVLEEQVSYWRRQLEGAPPVLELPTDLPRPVEQTSAGAQLRVQLPAALSEALGALARKEGATLFMALLAGLQALLGRYSGQDDLCVGAPIAGRRQAETEGLIGFFVNMLVLRTRLSGDPTFRELVARVREVTLGAYAHQDVPFEKLVEVLQPERRLGHTPLFQVALVLLNTPASELAVPGLTFRPIEADSGTSKLDLTLSLSETPQGLEGRLEYRTGLFEASTAGRMMEHLRRLLEGAVADPGRRLSELPLMSEAERHRVLVEWNATAVDYPRDACIHELFEAQVLRTPDRVAVEYEGARLTYRQLDERANRLAHHLVSRGVAPGDAVGICVERSLELVVGLLGILKAGGAYVPLDPSYPRERLGFMLEDTRMEVVLAQERFTARLPPHRAEVVDLDLEGKALASQPTVPPRIPVSARGLAYVIYTSGSTGRPKGVCIPHRAAVRLVMGKTFIDFGPEEVILQICTLAFDASSMEVWGSLLHGARLVVMPQAMLSLEELGRALGRHEVTTLFPTTPLYEQLVVHQPEALLGVRQIVAGGDLLSPARAREHLLRGGQLFNGYGPTENGTLTTCYRMEQAAQVGPSVSIGRPIANTRVYLLDAHLRPVPQGVPGELYAAGDGLAWGYLGRPELTAERFLPNPFDGEPGARMYRTGDLARHLPDGNLQFLGRRDTQVKVRGFRIELGEIESALSGFPTVREVAVVAHGEGAEGKRLVAYVVPREGQAAEPEVLRSFLRAKLPEHMVPSVFVRLEALPLTPSGKLDRRALPEPEGARGEGARPFVAPRTPTEERLARLLAQVLRVEQVGVHDDFFELGGHSLLATQLFSRIRTAFGVELPLRALFEGPTVAQLARRLESTEPAKGLERPVPPLVRAPRDRPLPLSFSQERMWRAFKRDPRSTAYNMPSPFWLSGRADPRALGEALQALVDRHESLRTTFAEEDGRPVQRVAPSLHVPLPGVDLRGHEDPKAEALRRAAEDAQQPFDLTRSPLVRATLLRLEDEEYLLLFCMHHILSDGWSMGVLLRELATLYRAFSEGREPALPPLPLQVPDYAAWQRSWLTGRELEERLGYWKEALASAPTVLALPTDRPRPPIRTFNGASHDVFFGKERSAALNALCQRERVTPFMALLAALGSVLAHRARQEEVLLGAPIAHRLLPELEPLIGLFINALVLRVSLRGGPAFRELLGRVREVTLGGYAHQEVPLDLVADAVEAKHPPDRSPVFQVMLALQNAPMPSVELPGLTLLPFMANRGGTNYDLALSLVETPEGFGGTLDYNTDLYEPATAERLTADLLRLLDAVIAEPDRKVGLDSDVLGA